MMGSNFYGQFGYNSMPTATQPYGYPMNPYTNNLQGQASTMQNVPSMPINTNKIFVTGIDDVKNRILPPNSEMIFLDNDKPLLYEKKVDATGKMEIRTLSLTEYTESNETPKEDNLVGYVKTSDFEAFKAEFEAYKENQNKSTKL